MWISSVLGRPQGAAPSTPPARPRRFRPVLEALEERCTPACSVVQTGGTLSITTLSAGLRRGNNHAIQVNDDGKGHVQAICDGAAPLSFSGVSSISVTGSNPVFLGLVEGRDTVHYNLTGPLVGTQGLTVNLKGGNDVFHANVTGGIGITSVADVPGNLSIFVQGDDGNDLIDFRLAGAVGRSSSARFEAFSGNGNDNMFVNATADVVFGGTLDLKLHGQAGDDHALIIYRGEVRGTLRTQEDGGRGDDRLTTSLSLTGEPIGPVEASELGGPDNDTMRLDFRKVPIAVFASIDGGTHTPPGIDRCFRTINVLKHINCQQDQLDNVFP